MTSRLDLATAQTQLKRRLMDLVPDVGDWPTGVPGFTLYRRNTPDDPQPVVYKPVLILVAQGAKWARIGTEEYNYGEGDCFIAGVEMPVISCMHGITPERPFVSLSLDIDKTIIAQSAAEVPLPGLQEGEACRGAAVHRIDADLLDAMLRLLELAGKPEMIAALSPLIIKEIHYRLLMGPFGNQLRAICTFGSQSNQISRAIDWLKDNYSVPLQVEELARQVHMATSTFHKHFKSMTSLSPLQYQKQLRLTEAQRLMVVEKLDASQAGLSVGYESQAQFNREYKRQFGEPPLRDVKRLHARQESL